MKRRTFLRAMCAAPAAAYLGRFRPVCAQEGKSVVSVVTDKRSIKQGGTIRANIVENMVEEAIKLACGCDSVEAAWRGLIPDLKDDDTIGIKVNCICSSMPTHPEVAYAVAHSLVKAGVKENNIIIWDRTSGRLIEGLPKCGYRLNSGGSGIRCLGTDASGVGYDRKCPLKVPSAGRDFPPSKLLSRMCQHIISVPVLKNHNTTGITGCMKNFYGAIPLGDRLALANVSAVHRNRGNPQIAELCANPLVKDKLRFSVLDALFGLYTGGPVGTPQWHNHQILASVDPVALDTVHLNIIDEKRKSTRRRPASVKAGHIDSAEKLGLGIHEPARITVKERSLS